MSAVAEDMFPPVIVNFAP